MIIKSYNLINILYALWPKVMCLLSLDFLSPVIPFFKGKPYSLSAILNCNVYCCVLPILWFIETKLGRHNWHHAQRVPEQFGDSATLWSKKLKASASYLSDIYIMMFLLFLLIRLYLYYIWLQRPCTFDVGQGTKVIETFQSQESTENRKRCIFIIVIWTQMIFFGGLF